MKEILDDNKIKFNNKSVLNKQSNQEKVLYPDTYLLILTAAFPEKYKNNEKELKKRFGGVEIWQCWAELSNGHLMPLTIAGKLNEKNFRQIRLVIDTHGAKNDEQSIQLEDLQYALSAINNYLAGKGIYKIHPETKVYIENLSCYGANKPLDEDQNMVDTTLEKEIQDYFGKEFDGRIFYAKLADKNYSMNTFLKDNGAFAHIMIPDNYVNTLQNVKTDHSLGKTNPAFAYYYLSNGKLRQYKKLSCSNDDDYFFLFKENTDQAAQLSKSRMISKLQQAQKNLDLWKPRKRNNKSEKKKTDFKNKMFRKKEDLKESNNNKIVINNQDKIQFDAEAVKRSKSADRLI